MKLFGWVVGVSWDSWTRALGIVVWLHGPDPSLPLASIYFDLDLNCCHLQGGLTGRFRNTG